MAPSDYLLPASQDFLNLPQPMTHGMYDIFLNAPHLRAIQLSREDAVGNVVLGVVGLVTALVILGMLAYLLSHFVRAERGERKERAIALRRFLGTDMGVYILNLLVSDLMMPLSSTANLKWSRMFIVYHSALCDFQGITNQLGVTSGAWFNVFIAAQTFSLLVLRVQPPPWVKWVVMSLGWLFALLMTSIGPATNDAPFSFFGPSSSGCWLTFGTRHYKSWYKGVCIMSIAVLLIMLILYIGLFLSLSGALERITNRVHSSVGGISSNEVHQSTVKRGKEVRKVARKMLYFPLSYGILSIPLVFCVLQAAMNKPLPHAGYIVGNALFDLIGLADVIIFILTCQNLLKGPSSLESTHPSQTGGAGSNSMGMVKVNTTYQTHASGPDGRLETVPYAGRQKASVFDDENEELGEDWEGEPKMTVKAGRRQSRTESLAKAEGEEDSFGLVLGDRRSGIAWEIMPSIDGSKTSINEV